MSPASRVAVVQAGSIPFDSRRSVEKAAALMAQVRAAGARLAVFPEAFISGYPKGLDFGARVGMRSPEGRSEFRRYWDGAIDVPGPTTEALGEAARKNGLHVVIGVMEREIGTLYCTVLFFAPDGRLLARHRKLMPTAMERLVWGFGDGSTLPVVDTPLGRLGSVICWENYMPMLRMAMYAKGVQLYCASTVDDRETWIPTIRHIALEGRCFVLSACQYITRGAYPAHYPAIQGDDPETVLIRGGSCIVSPLGEVLAGPEYDGERVLTAEIDLGEVARGKFDLDVVGHYARPDVFRLYVNERPTPLSCAAALRPAIPRRRCPTPAARRAGTERTMAAPGGPRRAPTGRARARGGHGRAHDGADRSPARRRRERRDRPPAVLACARICGSASPSVAPSCCSPCATPGPLPARSVRQPGTSSARCSAASPQEPPAPRTA